MNTRPIVAVTGANGFVGRAVCQRLVENGWGVRACVRSRERAASLPSGCHVQLVTDYADEKALMNSFRGAGGVVHLVAKTHCVDRKSNDSLDDYRACNVAISRTVAACAARSGVQRLVFMSSIKAVGEGAEEAYDEDSACRPEDAYGKTKLEAEQIVAGILAPSATRLTILRPPLVYGSQARGNLALLLRAIECRIPLPLGAVDNRRSMVHVRSLAEAVHLSLADSASSNRLFTVADPHPRSTLELVRTMAKGIGIRPIVCRMPPALLRCAGVITGRSEVVRRLTGSLTVDAARIRRELGWKPVIEWEQGICEMASEYRSARANCCGQYGEANFRTAA